MTKKKKKKKQNNKAGKSKTQVTKSERLIIS